MEEFATSQYKFTYLLGAGASAKVLPTVKGNSIAGNVPDSIRLFIQRLGSDSSVDTTYKTFIDEISGDLNWIADNTVKFGTPDTFAKYLYLKERSSLERFKKALSFYFTVEQFIYTKIDDRALIFLTTVMQIGSIFPTNIKILNWNYDFQIQLAGEVFKTEEFHQDTSTGATSHSPPLVTYYPSLGFEMNVNYDSKINREISMVHLNGIAGFFYHMEKSLFLNNFLNEKSKSINHLIEKLLHENEKKHTLLTFAWETETSAANLLRMRLEIAKGIISDSDILVIIGYSFPFFNREVDKQLFESLKLSGRLRKIIYQDPHRTGEFLRKQFDLEGDIEIIHVKEKDNYYLPTEL